MRTELNRPEVRRGEIRLDSADPNPLIGPMDLHEPSETSKERGLSSRFFRV